MKKILGLDLGTNSIGWAIVEQDFDKKEGKIIGIGSRIIPMSQNEISDFGKGITKSATALRTEKRGIRRLYQRDHLRRERLHRVLNILDFLPEHYKNSIIWGKEEGIKEKDWKKHGQFKENVEVKLPYKPLPKKNDSNKQEYDFIFKESFEKMLADFKKHQPDLFYKKKNGEETKIPYDWTIYYLRKKALTKKISDYELAWLILHFNTKRGYYQQRGDENIEEKDGKIIETVEESILSVEEINKNEYKVTLSDDTEYIEKSNIQLSYKGEKRLVKHITATKTDRKTKEKYIDKYKQVVYLITSKVTNIKKLDVDKKGFTKYQVDLENGMTFEKSKKREIDWLNKEKTVLLTYKIGENKTSLKISAPEETDWTLLKLKTEQDLNNSRKTVGEYIYDTLLSMPNQKIRGKLIRTIERKYYREELEKILQKQSRLNLKLQNLDLYEQCVDELYSHNESRRNILQNIKDENKFQFLFINDIIFYHRPLKSKKSLIANCKYETRTILIDRSDFETFFNKVKKNPNLSEKEKIEKIIEDIRFVKDEKIIQQDTQKGKNNRKVIKKNDLTEQYKDLINNEDLRKAIKEAETYADLLKELNLGAVYLTKFNKNPLKAVAKSNPYFQEFRIWQFISNLKILEKKKIIDGKLKFDIDVTSEYIKTDEDKIKLFENFYNRANIKQSQFLKLFKNSNNKILTSKTHKWNYIEGNEYPLNETKHILSSKFSEDYEFLRFYEENEYELWHLFYSITGTEELKKALNKLVKKNKEKYKFPENFVEKALKIKPFKKEYAAYSEKALKKLLPLIRIGETEDNVSKIAKENIDKIYERLKSISFDKEKIEQVIDDEITKGMLSSFIDFPNKKYTGLQVHQASYTVYGKHSEAINTEKWSSPKDIENYLRYEFKQHSLRNPIVEKVVTEALRVVQDIWEQFGNGKPDFFDEIHIELGRDLKNTKQEKERLTNINTKNKNTNARIRNILREFKENEEKYQIKNVNPSSPYQQAKFKIYENDILSRYTEKELEKEKQDNIKIADVIKSIEPTDKEIEKYKLWLEQKYRSPYTGEIIPLSKLFTEEYEVEHILPTSRITNNSFNNKVICEARINPDPYKGNQTGYEFILNNENRKVEELPKKNGEYTTIFSREKYEVFVNDNYSNNPKKAKILLSKDIPKDFIDKQKNDMRYISKEVTKLLGRIVREDGENEATPKRLLPVSGGVTSSLKQDWGLNHIWNDIVLPRFLRLNKLTGTKKFTYINKEGKEIATVPKELINDFNVKRIDHRHHAMDALIVACATRNHVNFINNKHSNKEQRLDIRNKIQYKKYKDNEKNYNWIYKKPWENFPTDAKNTLEKTIISFKQNIRVINLTNNKYWKYVKQKDGSYKKQQVDQKGKNWAIRKPLHEATYSAKIDLPWVTLKDDEFITATRQNNNLNKSFNENKIKKITDTGIQQILLRYLKQEKFKKVNKKGETYYDADLAFTPEGIEELNKNIKIYNKGKKHKPIYKVRTYEKGKGRFKVGVKWNNDKKYVQGSPNLFFAIYRTKNENGKTIRVYETVALNEVIGHQKQQAQESVKSNNRTHIPIRFEKGEFLFTLSPNDLVYVPSDNEKENPSSVDFKNLSKEQVKRIFVVNDFSSTIYFTPVHLATNIAPKEVDLSFDEKKDKLKGSYDTKTASFEGKQIKDICWKLKVNRIGQITGFEK